MSKAIALLLLALAVSSAVLSIHWATGASRLQGPGAIIGLPSGDVWLVVDRSLWQLDGKGRLRAELPTDQLKLPGPPGNLVQHPDGRVVATVRDDPTLYLLDPRTAAITDALRLQWPPPLAEHAARAINLAIHRDGRIAVATGGGHLVALFAADGSFLGQTTPGEYRFSNGLWWQGDALWTTDTNRFKLKRLDTRDMSVAETFTFPGSDSARFLGPARGVPKAAATSTMAALIRFHDDMDSGRVVLIDAAGHEKPLVQPAARWQPRDVAWLGEQLLATDASDFTVHRWSGDGRALPPFGSAEVHARWSRAKGERLQLRFRQRAALGSAIGLFLVGFGFALHAQAVERKAGIHGPAPRLDLLRTPVLSAPQLGKLRLLAAGSTLWPLAIAVPLALMILLSGIADSSPRALLAGSTLVLYLAMIAVGLRFRRALADPRFEPLFNASAVRRLQNSSAAMLGLGDDEAVIETFTLAGLRSRWVVATDRQLLTFSVGTFKQILLSRHRWDEITSVSTNGSGSLAGRLCTLLRIEGWLEITLSDGTRISGKVVATAQASRAADWINSRLGLHDDRARQAEQPVMPVTPVIPGWRRPWSALASLLAPGLGQWSQRRRGDALVMFLGWTLVLVFITFPVLWAASGPKAEVQNWQLGVAIMTPALLAVAAAWDAWRLGRA